MSCGHILMSMPLPARDFQLVQIMDASLADAARRAGAWLVCRLGCTQCCHGAFAINALDAERLRAGIDVLRRTDPARAAELARRARAWVDQHGPQFPGNGQTGILGDSEEDRERFEEFANEAPCPALDPATGSCDIYAWRPMTCRVFGPPVRLEGSGIACCELCFAGASDEQIAACEMSVPHQLESELVAEAGGSGETVVAFALLR